MVLAQPHSYKGYINDFKLTLPNGTELVPTRVDGAPVGEEFYRGGDFVATHFDLVFPKHETALFTDAENAVMLTGNVCHEPVSIPLQARKKDKVEELDRIEPGEYKAYMLTSEETDGEVRGLRPVELEKFIVNADGSITVKGDTTGHLKDGKYCQKAKNIEDEDSKQIELSLKKETIEFRAISMSSEDGAASQIQMMPVIPENTDPDELPLSYLWGLILLPVL